MQFSNIDADFPQTVRIQWQELRERDSHGRRPDSDDEGFWPSLDPDSPGWIGSPEAGDVDGKAHAAKYKSQMRKARRRLNAWLGGKWHYIGVRARAAVYIPIGGKSFRVLILESAGLWGIESDSAESYLASVYAEERESLLGELQTLSAALAAGDYVTTEAARLEHDY